MLVTRRQIIEAGAEVTVSWLSIRLTPHSEMVIGNNLRAVYNIDSATKELKAYLTRIDHLRAVNKKRTESKTNSVLKALKKLKKESSSDTRCKSHTK